MEDGQLGFLGNSLPSSQTCEEAEASDAREVFTLWSMWREEDGLRGNERSYGKQGALATLCGRSGGQVAEEERAGTCGGEEAGVKTVSETERVPIECSFEDDAELWIPRG